MDCVFLKKQRISFTIAGVPLSDPMDVTLKPRGLVIMPQPKAIKTTKNQPLSGVGHVPESIIR